MLRSTKNWMVGLIVATGVILTASPQAGAAEVKVVIHAGFPHHRNHAFHRPQASPRHHHFTKEHYGRPYSHNSRNSDYGSKHGHRGSKHGHRRVTRARPGVSSLRLPRRCHPVHKIVTDKYGHHAKIRGTLCHRRDGVKYVVPGSRHVVNRW